MSTFFLLCVSMGVLQFAENSKLLYQKGEQLILDHSFSAIELVWLCVSLWFLFQDDLPLMGILAISLFTAYHLFGWLVAFRAYQLAEEEDSDTIAIPLWYFKVNMGVCVLFAIVSYLAFQQANG